MTTNRPADREHPAVIASRALLEIATTYPALVNSLARSSNPGSARVSGNPETPLPYREAVSEMLSEVAHLAWYLSQRLIFETDGKNRVQQRDLPDLPDERLAMIARQLIGHFTPDDSHDSQEFARDVERLAERVEAAAYPQGSRWVTVPNQAHEQAARRDPMPCAEVGCTGHYRMRFAAESRWGITVADPHTWPPLTCSADKSHIVTGVELARSVAWAKSNGTTHIEELRAWRAA